jgi:hypothetical protein
MSLILFHENIQQQQKKIKKIEIASNNSNNKLMELIYEHTRTLPTHPTLFLYVCTFPL